MTNKLAKSGRAGSPLPVERVMDQRRRARSDAPYRILNFKILRFIQENIGKSNSPTTNGKLAATTRLAPITHRPLDSLVQ
jgi:hypothetical protein